MKRRKCKERPRRKKSTGNLLIRFCTRRSFGAPFQTCRRASPDECRNTYAVKNGLVVHETTRPKRSKHSITFTRRGIVLDICSVYCNAASSLTQGTGDVFCCPFRGDEVFAASNSFSPTHEHQASDVIRPTMAADSVWFRHNAPCSAVHHYWR